DFVQRASALIAKGRTRPATPAARAEPAPAAAIPPPSPPPPAPGAEEVHGVPAVIDTGTLAFRGRVVKLLGLEGQGGHLARQL
ncbi:hypothetical protein ABK046_50090, partial [Streptomyces caeruleatus]